MENAEFTLRPYQPRDEDACIALWLRTWQAAYPQLDFNARLDWWRRAGAASLCRPPKS